MYKLPERYNNELKETFKRTMIITIAMIVECPIMFLVAYFLVEYSAIRTNPDFQYESLLRNVFFGIAILSASASYFLKKWILTPKTHEKAKDIVEIIRKISIITIVIFAIGNISVTLGFVYYILSGDMKIFQLFIILSVIVYVLCLPRIRAWEELLLYIVRNKPGFTENV
jgi:hypothetical protein